MTTTEYTINDRRVFPSGYALPHLSIYVPAGAVGTVVHSDEYIVSIKLDDPIPNLVDSEWENCIDFSVDADPGCVEAFTAPVTTGPVPLSRLAAGSDFIGAGDEVAVISEDGRHIEATGILVDVRGGDGIVLDGDQATVQPDDGGEWIYVEFARLAHADSPQSDAVAMFGDDDA